MWLDGVEQWNKRIVLHSIEAKAQNAQWTGGLPSQDPDRANIHE
jgi:hypothetical protein